MTQVDMRRLLRQKLDRQRGWQRCDGCGLVNLVHPMGTRVFCRDCVIEQFRGSGLEGDLDDMIACPYSQGVTVWADRRGLWYPAQVTRRGRDYLVVLFHDGSQGRRPPWRLALRNPAVRGRDCPGAK